MPAPTILRPAALAYGLGRRVERGARRRAVSGAGQLAEDLVRYRVVERMSLPVLASGTVERVLDHADTAGLPQRVADRLLADGIAEQVAERVLAGPELERIVRLVLESPGFAGMLAQVVESRAVDETVARVVDETVSRLPRSPAMWNLIDEIAGSPAVTEAIAQQSAGFADHVAGTVRDRSRTADAKLERAAWTLLRRRSRDPAVEGGPAGAT